MTRRPRRVILLAYESMNLLDLAGPLQALATANRFGSSGGVPLYETVVASAEGGPVITGSGLPIVTVPLSDLEGVTIDTLIAPGGCSGQTYEVPDGLVSWIRGRAASVRRLCSVCTGAFLLAAAGQLDGRRVATHWAWLDQLKGRHPAIDVDADRIFIQDGSVWTSAGVSAGIDLTLALIEDDFGYRVAIDTARQLVVFMKREGGQSQFSVPLAAQLRDERFVDLHAWIAANLHDDLSVERLAAKTGMAPRTFARAYRAKVGRTPAKMVEAMRVEAACRVLEVSSLPLKTVADLAGYSDELKMRRAFHRQLGVSPIEYRDRFSSHASSVGAFATGSEPAK